MHVDKDTSVDYQAHGNQEEQQVVLLGSHYAQKMADGRLLFLTVYMLSLLLSFTSLFLHCTYMYTDYSLHQILHLIHLDQCTPHPLAHCSLHQHLQQGGSHNHITWIHTRYDRSIGTSIFTGFGNTCLCFIHSN